MKVAKVRYTGQMRSANRRCPSGTQYHLPQYDGLPEREWVAVDDLDDAQHLAELPNIEIRWKPLGRLRAMSDDALAAVSDLGYQTKQRLVGEDGFDLDVAGNASDDELEKALKEHVEELNEAGEL